MTISLRAALRTIHSDPSWPRKVLIGGVLMSTLVGYPFASGLVVEHLDNSRKGFPVPLPVWRELGTRFLFGLLSAMVDFLFFVMPWLAAGLIFFCVGVGMIVATDGSDARLLFPIIGSALGILLLSFFLLSAAPIGRLIYVEDGTPERALSGAVLREALRPDGRGVYFRARLASLPAYLPFLVILSVTLAVIARIFDGWWPMVLPLVWLTCAALQYAHLVVMQLYVAAESQIGGVLAEPEPKIRAPRR